MTSATDVQVLERIRALEDQVEYLNTLDRGGGGGAFVPLTTPLTSTDFDGDAFSTTAKTKIDLSVKFGAPAGIRAALIEVGINDSGSDSAGQDVMFGLAPNDTDLEFAGLLVIRGFDNDRQFRQTMVVPCDSNGDIYYQCIATGTDTLDVVLQVWGYWS